MEATEGTQGVRIINRIKFIEYWARFIDNNGRSSRYVKIVRL